MGQLCEFDGGIDPTTKEVEPPMMLSRAQAISAVLPRCSRQFCSAASLTHIDASGEATMVDVSAKSDTKRVAVAASTVRLGSEAFGALAEGANAKGNVLATARLAGIMAAKRTSELIPLCHPLSLSHVGVEMTEVRKPR